MKSHGSAVGPIRVVCVFMAVGYFLQQQEIAGDESTLSGPAQGTPHCEVLVYKAR